MSISTRRSVDLNTGYFIYYLLILTVGTIVAYLSISVAVGFAFYWAIHYILKVANAKLFFIHGLSYGDSMKPALPDGLKLLILMYPINLSKNDVIVYKSNDQLVKHRIIDIETDSGSTLYYVKGDNDTKVESIRYTDIQAKQLQLFSKLLYIPLSPLAISG